jgi:hypothetical protein
VCLVRFMVESPAQSGRLKTLIHPGPVAGVHVIPSRPSTRYRLCHLPTVMLASPMRMAIDVFVSPATHSKTVWARCMIECFSDLEQARAWSRWTWSTLRTSGGVGRPGAM